jgi:hypothetical protein
MKTTKPNHINYTMQYQLMRLSEALMPLMPERIIDKFSAVMTPRMEQAEEQASLMHVDRYDMIVDWGCTAQHIVRKKIHTTNLINH